MEWKTGPLERSIPLEGALEGTIWSGTLESHGNPLHVGNIE